MSKPDNEAYAKGKELAKQLAQLVNPVGHRDQTEGFIEQLSRYEHPTLQQQVFELFLKLSYRLAALEHFDLRNEETVKRARQIKEALGQYGDCLPFI